MQYGFLTGDRKRRWNRATADGWRRYSGCWVEESELDMSRPDLDILDDET